ncbi:MAG: ArsB/NhaD family transporter [Candidatus Eremiobacteraeota bacterium]|nr:ArsB/NhaD family transporter [Candidatus Eremiobacteraeota bacterium]
MPEPKMIVSALIFIVTFTLIMSEKVHRTTAAMLGASAMVLAGTWMGFYNAEEAFKAVDLETIGLLMGMMIILAMLERTGFFEYVAIFAALRSKGNPVVLLVALGTTTTVLSMFLDNVTTVVLIGPVTILICRMLGISPVPFLMAEALLSDTGGVATLVGDPPNIMIGSASGLTFMDFIIHLAPQVLVAWIIALVVLMIVFRKTLRKKPKGLDALMHMDVASVLKDRVNARRLMIVLGAVIVLFFLHSAIHLKPSVVALMGAAAALLWVRPRVEEIFTQVELAVLVFFAALFVTVGGLEHSGILTVLAKSIVGLAKSNCLHCCIFLIWASAVASALVDNIPFTMAMIPVIQYLETQGVMVTPLWWALALGVGFGGNGTPIGSTANVVIVSLSEKTSTPITTRIWLKSGLVVMLATCMAATLTFILFFNFMKY